MVATMVVSCEGDKIKLCGRGGILKTLGHMTELLDRKREAQIKKYLFFLEATKLHISSSCALL